MQTTHGRYECGELHFTPPCQPSWRGQGKLYCLVVIMGLNALNKGFLLSILPLFTKSRAVYLPMPVFEPVTMAVLPSSRALPVYLEQHTISSTHVCLTTQLLQAILALVSTGVRSITSQCSTDALSVASQALYRARKTTAHRNRTELRN